MKQKLRRIRTIAAWVLLIGSIVGYPISALTIAKTEPPVVLFLSWFAIILTSADLLTSSQVNEEQNEKNGGK